MKTTAFRSLLLCLFALVIGVVFAACGGDDEGSSSNSDPNQCADDCTLDDTRCSDGGLQTCVSVGDCPSWSDAEDCPDDEICSGGACSDECLDICEDGERQCDGSSAYRVCEEQSSGCLDWSSTRSCDAGLACEDGLCSGDESCEDGDERCANDGLAVEVCVGGEWEANQGCSIGCEDAQCVDEVDCSPGQLQCNGPVVEICNASGSAYLHLATCSVDCADGLCVGDCEPGERRCNGDEVEVCNGAGTAWDVEESCDDTRCEPTTGTCSQEYLDITSDTELDGPVFVDGPVTVRTGADLYSPTGELYIFATSISVESGGSITLAATGEHPDGQGGDDIYYGGGGGGHGEHGEPAPTVMTGAGSAFARSDEVDVTAGSRGGTQSQGGAPGMGGGVLHLMADTIDVSGSLRADGGDGTAGSDSGSCWNRGHGGGGSGGGVLLAADEVDFTGSISVQPGDGAYTGCTSYYGGDGGGGVVKLLYGGGGLQNNGTVHGVTYEGLKAPMPILSSTHPDPSMTYNDDFDDIVFSWQRPFPSLQGYYRAFNTTRNFVPSANNASFLPEEVVAYSREDAEDGANYFHITAIDAQSVIGEMESRMLVQVNTLPPLPGSSSHSDSEEWSSNPDVLMTWSDPRGDDFLNGYHYRVDQWGDTVPDHGDTFAPISQKQQLFADRDDGIWAFHIVSVDTMGYLTRESGTHVFRIGDDPGQGQILGTVVDQDGTPVEGAYLSVNRGLLRDATDDAVTTSSGAYNYGPIPAGEWSLQVRADGFETKEISLTLSADEDRTVDVTLDAL